MAQMLAASATIRPVGPLGAAIVAGAIVVAVAYFLGSLERRHWGGRPPTAQEFLQSKRKVGRVQYSTSQWSPRVLLVAAVVFVVGLALLAYGILGSA